MVNIDGKKTSLDETTYLKARAIAEGLNMPIGQFVAEALKMKIKWETEQHPKLMNIFKEP